MAPGDSLPESLLDTIATDLQSASLNPTVAPESAEGLRNEFRALITLLTLVAAINNNGHALLKYDTGEAYRAPLEPIQRWQPVLNKHLLLDAFAAIFVRDHEIIATAAASQPVSVPSTDGGMSQVWQLLAIQDDHDGYYVDPSDKVREIATFANPQGRIRRPWDPVVKAGKGQGCRGEEGCSEANSAQKGVLLLGLEDIEQLPQGKSYYKHISNENWSWIHEIM